MKTEQWLLKLGNEIKAMKQSSDLSAVQLATFSKTLDMVSTRNPTDITTNTNSYTANDPERIILTLDTYSGNRTYAKLEYTCSQAATLPNIRVVPYEHGIRWIISNTPDYSGNTWQSTTYSFTVHSLANGVLSFSEVGR